MKNEERLLAFLEKRWEDAGKPEYLPLSSYAIAREWTIRKNHRVVKWTPVEVSTSAVYVNVLLKKLAKEGLLKYDTTQKSRPVIKLTHKPN